MNWDILSILYFMTSADTLNFSMAARQLYISPQALHKRITTLEEELGRPLFRRTTRSMALTDAGRVCYETLLPVRDAYMAAMKKLGVYSSAGRELRFSFFHALPKARLVTQMVSFLKFHNPSLKIRLEAAELDEVYPLLLGGEIDLCVTHRHEFEKWDASIESFVLARYPAQIVFSKEHRWASQEKITLEDMSSEPIVVMERRHPTYESSMYSNIPSREIITTQKFDSLLANLEFAQSFAVFPMMFEHQQHVNLTSRDLPEKLGFVFELRCGFKKDSHFTELFRLMKQYYEQTPLL